MPRKKPNRAHLRKHPEHSYIGYTKRGCRCQVCCDAWREWGRQYRAKNPHVVAKHNRGWYERKGRAQRLAMYGLTPEDYEEMVQKQEGKCACCLSEPSGKHRLVVDHCHDTGVVRGLICSSCNLGIGCLGDSVEGVRRAVRYLTKKRTKATKPGEDNDQIAA